MASQKVDTGLGNDPEKDGEGATNPARRLFLFKRPLDGSGSGSTGVDDSETGGGNEQNAGNQGLELSLPRILDTFHILCHIGVIVIDEDVYTDTNLTALQKMATGLVYEHAGPEMGSSQAATGIRVDEAVIRTFTALEFIGYTSRTNGQLDVLLQDLLRVDRNPASAPVYHTLYWNCQDIAIRFARVASDDHAGSIQPLARLFEFAKINVRNVQNLAMHFGVPWVSNALFTSLGGATLALGSGAAIGSGAAALGAGALVVPATPAIIVGVVMNRISRNLPIAYQVYNLSVADHQALSARCDWMVVLENRFPALRGLGRGSDGWREIADSMGSISQRLLPAIQAALFGT